MEVGERRTLLGASPRGVSQTLVQYARVRAVAAADVAAPVEGAVAALGDALCARAVAPATAEQLLASSHPPGFCQCLPLAKPWQKPTDLRV